MKGYRNEEDDPEKRHRKVQKFYKQLASWAGTSVFLLALDLFLSGGISWSKYPVFFWGIAIAMQFFNVLRLQWMMKKEREAKIELPNTSTAQKTLSGEVRQPDYSDELLKNQNLKEKEIADLAEYRKLKKPWKDEDLV